MRFLQPEALGLSGPQEMDPCACTQQSFDRQESTYRYSLFLELKSVLVSRFLSTVGSKDPPCFFFVFLKGMWVCHWAVRWMTPDVVVYTIRVLSLSWGPSGWSGHWELRFIFLLQVGVQWMMSYGPSRPGRVCEGKRWWRGFKITCQTSISVCPPFQAAAWDIC